jgi:hypothetical protein
VGAGVCDEYDFLDVFASVNLLLVVEDTFLLSQYTAKAKNQHEDGEAY